MIFEPKYQKFLIRVWSQISKTILLLSVIIILVAAVSKINLLHAALIGILPATTLLFIRSIFINKFYLKSIEIHEDKQYVRLIILKYDKDFKVYTLSLKELMVRINPIFFSLRPYYKLQFLQSRTLIYEQGECVPWPIELFKEVLNRIKSFQQQQSK
jgi:hypothetical protein